MAFDWEDLVRANKTITTTDIKGKEYAEVNQRIKAFRMLCPGGCIKTELVSVENGVCIFVATVFDEEGRILGTGTAYEKENSTFINKTSYIENCETSAVGRALGMCGFGIDTSIASAEEVANAINNQEKTRSKGSVEKTPRERLIMMLKKRGVNIAEYAKEKGISTDTTSEEFEYLISELED